MRIVFYKYKHLLQIKELKNKKAGPANHSLTTFLQKQGVKPYMSKIVKNDTTPSAYISKTGWFNYLAFFIKNALGNLLKINGMASKTIR